ncbi:pimelyl-ACP methyl ester esterase [Vibrio sp. qd031]|uniref:pimeloyl-ACP methyl ester esterase BioH n=1 Tax=Vibrio sp. qd031 TaxID=1603038 RepID=UPI000A11B556|nr:pimeloyl-ACP methyl ester esterase BioH [Vibrio sp. qd031]ORT51655.1 pimelyl-ACP methyl ester esterase [Vibrio sp. qd031]
MTTEQSLHWQIQGQGPNLVLLHGWGMNGAVWEQLLDALSPHFTLFIADLPGYGHSNHIACDTIDSIADAVLIDAPEHAIWLGWSLGGLIATHVAHYCPQRVTHLVTVASSPKFAQARPWRGIKPEVLSAFTEQLLDDLPTTVDRFMALQAMGSPSARKDTKQLKQAVLSRPAPSPKALQLGLDLLADIDYRDVIPTLTMPVARWYGRLDGLVPVKVASDLDVTTQEHHASTSHVFQQSSHAPFITEAELFCEMLIEQFSTGKNQ